MYADIRADPDPAAAHARWVERRAALFHDHPATARQPGQELHHAAYDPAYRFVLEMQAAEPDEWEPTTGSDGAVPFRRGGASSRSRSSGGLDAWWLGSYGERDLPTAARRHGREDDVRRGPIPARHGQGRGPRPREGLSWVLDLNFSYNPSCAYDPSWACPLAPLGNRLAAEVPVGELAPTST